MLKHTSYFEKIDPRLFAALMSVLFSIWCGINFFINPDGILYINYAKELSVGNSVVLDPRSVNLPFYPLLIHFVHNLLPISWVTAALTVNAVFFALLAVGFIQIIKALGGDTLTCWIAAIVILTQPEINHFRGYIIRDIGFWTLLYWSLFALIQYQRTNLLRYVLLWYVAGLGMVLFRIEGFILFIFGPLFLLFEWKLLFTERLKRTLLFYGFEFLALLILCYIVLTSEKQLGLFAHLGRLFTAWWIYVSSDFFAHLSASMERLSRAVPVYFHRSYIPVFLIGGFLSYFIARIVQMFSPLYALLLVFGIRKPCFPRGYKNSWHLLSYWVVLTVTITLVFLSKMLFLSGRYVFPTCILGFITLPFILTYFYREYAASIWQRYSRVCAVLISLLIVGLLIHGLVSFGYSKDYIKQAGAWIDTHSEPQATLYTNSPQIAFYAQRDGKIWNENIAPDKIDQVLKNKEWKKYDYLGILVGGRQEKIRQNVLGLIRTPPAASFSNKRGDTVYIFKVSH